MSPLSHSKMSPFLLRRDDDKGADYNEPTRGGSIRHHSSRRQASVAPNGGRCATAGGLSARQIKRLVQRYRQLGATGLVSKQRGKRPNTAISAAVKQQALQLIHQHDADFSPTFAHEKLTEAHEFNRSVETLRQWMIADGLWQSRQHIGKHAFIKVVHAARVLVSGYKSMARHMTGLKDARTTVR